MIIKCFGERTEAEERVRSPDQPPQWVVSYDRVVPSGRQLFWRKMSAYNSARGSSMHRPAKLQSRQLFRTSAPTRLERVEPPGVRVAPACLSGHHRSHEATQGDFENPA